MIFIVVCIMSLFCVLAGADTVITTDHAVRGGKLINLKQTVDNAVSKCPSIRNVFVSQRTGLDVPMGKLDKVLEKVGTC